MASEKQIAANRANAKRSTGPKTQAGKVASSRNAFRHGFSAPLRFDSVTSAKVDAIAHALAGEGAKEDMLTSAADFARAQLELGRIRSKRTELTEKLRLDHNDMQGLGRVAALDRYERYFLTKRRRASASFEAGHKERQSLKARLQEK
jgi:hypothetical protein